MAIESNGEDGGPCKFCGDFQQDSGCGTIGEAESCEASKRSAQADPDAAWEGFGDE